MNNEIAERTIKSHYVIIKWPPQFYSEVCNFCAEEITVCISTLFLDWATTNLLAKKLWQFASLREGRMSPAVLAKFGD